MLQHKAFDTCGHLTWHITTWIHNFFMQDNNGLTEAGQRFVSKLTTITTGSGVATIQCLNFSRQESRKTTFWTGRHKQGYNNVKFERFHVISVWEKQILKSLTNQEMHQVSPLIMLVYWPIHNILQSYKVSTKSD